mgnify:CR=1 FL=1
MSFALTREAAGEAVVVVSPAGDLDAYTAPEVRAALTDLIEEGAAVVVCDLSAVTFLDSSGLGALIGALKRLRERGGELLIVQPGPSARRIFALTALDRVLPLFDSRAEALAAARRPGG